MIPGTLSISTTITVGKKQDDLWRVLHDLELDGVWRKNLPEVVPGFPNHFVAFSKYWQLLSKEMNPLLTPKAWTQVYTGLLWIANRQGFDMPGDPRANFVTGANLGAELPRVENLTTGESVVKGKKGYSLTVALQETLAVIKDAIVERKGFMPVRKSFAAIAQNNVLFVEMLNVNDPPPTAEWLREHREFCTIAVTVDGKGTPRRFPQGEQPNGYMAEIIHPFVGDPVRFKPYVQLSRVTPWTEPGWPDPFKVYLPR